MLYWFCFFRLLQKSAQTGASSVTVLFQNPKGSGTMCYFLQYYINSLIGTLQLLALAQHWTCSSLWCSMIWISGRNEDLQFPGTISRFSCADPDLNYVFEPVQLFLPSTMAYDLRQRRWKMAWGFSFSQATGVTAELSPASRWWNTPVMGRSFE